LLSAVMRNATVGSIWETLQQFAVDVTSAKIFTSSTESFTLTSLIQLRQLWKIRKEIEVKCHRSSNKTQSIHHCFDYNRSLIIEVQDNGAQPWICADDAYLKTYQKMFRSWIWQNEASYATWDILCSRIAESEVKCPTPSPTPTPDSDLSKISDSGSLT